jgi:hypothetical protein
MWTNVVKYIKINSFALFLTSWWVTSVIISVFLQNPWRWDNYVAFLLYSIFWPLRFLLCNCILSFAYCSFLWDNLCVRLIFIKIWLHKYCCRFPSDNCVGLFGSWVLVFVLLRLFSCHLLGSLRPFIYRLWLWLSHVQRKELEGTEVYFVSSDFYTLKTGIF